MTTLQNRLDQLLSRNAASTAVAPNLPKRRFSAFRLPDVFKASRLATGWARSFEDAGIGEVLHRAQAMLAGRGDDPYDVELVQYALALFLTHYPHGTGLRIKPLESRHPEMVMPSSAGGAAPTPESALDWWREDPKLNEHHEHWHVVYGLVGVPSEFSPLGGKLKSRHGELFLFMHRQMIARYETERLATGLPRLEPWSRLLDDTDPYGYDPGRYLRPYYGPRPPGRGWRDVQDPGPGRPAELVKRHERFLAASRAGYFDDESEGRLKVPISADLYGATLEADIGSVEAVAFDPSDFDGWYEALEKSHYGNLHNDGHVAFAELSEGLLGVMTDTRVSVRDHIFFRWHKYIDDLWLAWEQTWMATPNDFAADAPAVIVRQNLPGAREEHQSPDILLSIVERLNVQWDDWAKFADIHFGGDHWDEDFSAGLLTTNTLETQMLRRMVTIEPGADSPTPREAPHLVEYLDQKEFHYFFRVESTADQDRDVTARIFLCDRELVDDRRMWIELDKFQHTLPAKRRTVIFRPASLSSVVRKPAVKPASLHEPPVVPNPDNPQMSALLPENYCDCGWPYNLLLPRSTFAGRTYRLMIMLTDWHKDHVPCAQGCGSMSYCGAREDYPDIRPMGYPFDRPFKLDADDKPSFDLTFGGLNNVATRDVTIRRVPGPHEGA